MLYIIMSLFFLIPLAAVAFFIICLVNFCVAAAKSKREPESVSNGKLRSYLVLLIISFIIAAVIGWVFIDLIIFLNTPITMM